MHPDYGIDRIEHPRFPCLYFRKYTVCDGTDCLGLYTVTEILFQPVANFTCTVSHCMQTNYTATTHSTRIDSYFLMNLELKLKLRSRGVETVTLPNEVWTCFSSFVTTVTHLTFFFCQMSIHFTFQSCIQYTFQ